MTRAELFRGYSTLVQELYAPDAFARRVRCGFERMGRAIPGTNAARPPDRRELADFLRAMREFSFSRDPVHRGHFLPNWLQMFLRRPQRCVETAIHLGLWRHFETFIPQLVASLAELERNERGRGPVSNAATLSAARALTPTALPLWSSG